MKTKDILIRKTNTGFVCEIKKTTLLFFHKWIPYIKYYNSKYPTTFHTFDQCLDEVEKVSHRNNEFVNISITA